MVNDENSIDKLLTLDGQAIERLKRDMGEDMPMVLEAYVESIDELLDDIANRTAHTPDDDLHRWAHSLKSSAATIGAMKLSHLAAQMEHSYRDRRSIDVAAHLLAMQGEYLLVGADLKKLVID